MPVAEPGPAINVVQIDDDIRGIEAMAVTGDASHTSGASIAGGVLMRSLRVGRIQLAPDAARTASTQLLRRG
jgi:hypothetical protein